MFTAHGSGYVSVNGRQLRQSAIVTPEEVIAPWGAARAAELTEADITRIADLDPEVVVLGTGARQVFPPPALVASLLARRIGVEVMDTAAACRTYNILAAEGRRVVAAVLVSVD